MKQTVTILQSISIVALCLLLLPSTFQAQNTDLAVVDIRMTSDSNNLVTPGMDSPVEIIVVNADSIILEAGHAFGLYIDFSGYYDVSDSIMLLAPLGSGDSLTIQLGIDQRFPLPDSNNVVVPVAVYLSDSSDTNLINNGYGEDFTTSNSVLNDWSTTMIQVVEPMGLDSFDIDNGSNIPPPLTHVDITFNNEGGLTYLEHTAFRYVIYLGADSVQINATLSEIEVAPGSGMTRSITNPAILPMVPDSVGDYSLCAYPMEENDPDPSNDVSCYTFSIVDNFDPSDPANWPFGLEESSEDAFSIQWNDRSGFVDGPQGSYVLECYALNGTAVLNKAVQAGNPVVLEGLSPGIYILRASSEKTGAFASRKVLIP